MSSIRYLKDDTYGVSPLLHYVKADTDTGINADGTYTVVVKTIKEYTFSGISGSDIISGIDLSGKPCITSEILFK